MAKISSELQTAIDYLKRGDVIGIPTETVYGLAGNAFSEDAVLKIFTTKNRPSFDPLIVHVADVESINKIATYVSPAMEKLMQAFSPGPLTYLLPKKANISDLITSGLPNVAIRIPNHPLTLELLQQIDFPLAAPSANPFGYVSPTSPQHVEHQLGTKIPYILDGGTCQIGLESTIIGEQDGQLTVYRLGGLSIEQLEEVAGKVIVNDFSSSNPKAPGMLKSHYAPSKKIRLLDSQNLQDRNVGFIGFQQFHPDIPPENQLLLSENGSVEEAAKNLFATLREVENLNGDEVFVRLLPETGLGRAINDRLRRAAAH